MTVGAIRQAIQELAECPVCRRPPDLVDASTFPWNQDIEMVAKCHGSTDRGRISTILLEVSREDRIMTVVGEWLDGLFAADTLPDVMELIRYNNDPWVLR